MAQVLVPAHVKSGGTPYADLVQNPDEGRRVLQGFVKILAESFQEDEVQYGPAFRRTIQNASEEKRRADILGKWYRIMRGELGWGFHKTMDSLPKALRTELHGGKYEPPTVNRLWTPGSN